MSNADYEPRSQRSRPDKPRYKDDRDDDYPEARPSRRPRYDDPPPSYLDAKGPPRDARRGAGSDLDDDPRADKRAPPMERDPRDLESKPRRKARNAYDSDEDERPTKIKMRDNEASGDYDRPRAKGYDEPMPRGDGRRRDRDALDDPEPPRRRPKERDPHDEPEPPRRRDKGRDPYDEPPPIRRRNTEKDVDRRRRDDRYNDDDDERPRRRRDDDRHGESRGYRSDGRDLDRNRDDRGYRSDGRDARRRRDDDYDSDRGYRRSDRSDRDRDGRRDKGRDRYDSDRDRDRKREKDKKKGGISLRAEDLSRYAELGQKHYKTAKPIIDQLAKLYMESKK